MRKVVKYGITSVVLIAALLTLAVCATYRAARYEPEFYRAVLQAEPARQVEAGDELENAVLELHNNARQAGGWQAVFSDEQVNGWLASDLPEKFPSVLPAGVEDPRVVIQSDRALVACRFESKGIKSVISFELEAHLTEDVNTLAVRIRRVRAGALPVPLRQVLDQISDAALQADIWIRWSQIDGDPVALVTLPTEYEGQEGRQVYLETLELRDGEIHLSGHTEGDELPEEAMEEEETGDSKREADKNRHQTVLHINHPRSGVFSHRNVCSCRGNW